MKDEHKRQQLQLSGSPQHGKNTLNGESWGGTEVRRPLAVTHWLLTAKDEEGGGVEHWSMH